MNTLNIYSINLELIVGAQITQTMVNVPEQVLTPGTGALSMYFIDNQVWIRTATGDDFLIGPGTGSPSSNLPAGTAPNQSLVWNGSQWVPSSTLLINDTDSTVDIDGRLFLEDTVADTSPAVAGQLRHNANDLEFYNGTVWISLTSASGSNDYTRPTSVKEAVGGLTTSYVPNGTIQDLLDDMLYPFQNPSISLSGLGLREKGTTVNPVNLNYNVTPRDAIVDTRSLFRGATLITTPTTNSGSFADTSGIVWNSPDLTWTFQVAYTNFSTQSVSRTLSFVAPSYHGVGPIGLNETQIKALSKAITNTKNRTLTFSPTLERYYFVYPQSLGALSTILDQNGFDVTSSFIQDTATFTLADTVTTESYYIYYNNSDTTQVNFEITFS